MTQRQGKSLAGSIKKSFWSLFFLKKKKLNAEKLCICAECMLEISLKYYITGRNMFERLSVILFS